MKPEQRINEFIEEKIAGTDLFLVDLRILPKSRVVILIDGDQGLQIDKCAEISRHVGHRMEEENIIDHAFTLEVSSPGIDHPLKFRRQYVKNVGRHLSLKMNDGAQRQGKLLEVKEDSLMMEEQIKEKGKKAYTQEAEVNFADLKEAKVVIALK